jgi:putative ABC transport system substrate-binding protein
MRISALPLGLLLPFPRENAFNTALLDELRRDGFIEGKNLAIDYRAFGQHVDLLPQYAAELVKAQVDAVLGGGGAATHAVQQATNTIPVVAVADDMVAEGLVASMVRPSGNTTGVSIFATELDGKRQEILIEAVPGLRRMAVLVDAKNTAAAKLEGSQAAARAQNIELSIHRVVSGDEMAAAIDTATSSGARAINVLASPMLHANFELINGRATAFRLAAIYQWPELAEAGGFAAYGPRLTSGELPQRVARLIAKVFRGVKPADLPIEQPTKFKLVINLKTANAVGVKVPATLLVRADEVIE